MRARRGDNPRCALFASRLRRGVSWYLVSELSAGYPRESPATANEDVVEDRKNREYQEDGEQHPTTNPTRFRGHYRTDSVPSIVHVVERTPYSLGLNSRTHNSGTTGGNYVIPGTYDFSFTRGDGHSFLVTIQNGDGTAYDTAAAPSTFFAQWRREEDAADVQNFTVTDTGGGILRLDLTGLQTAVMVSGVWDLEERRPLTPNRTLLAGHVTVRKDVTHA